MTVFLANGPPDVIAFALVGENDAYDAERLSRTLDALPKTSLPLIIDLGNTTFVDSAIVSTLLECFRTAATSGRALALVLPESTGEQVRRLFKTTHLDSLLPVYDSWDDALAGIRPNDGSSRWRCSSQRDAG